MSHSPRWLPTVALLGAAALMLTACPAPVGEDDPPFGDPAMEDPPEPERQLYEARLEEVGGSGVSGSATLTIDGHRLQATVVASGLDPDVRVPQHVHMNASCDAAGGILLSLDDQLSVADEAGPRGGRYPQADGDGELEHEVSRPLDDLESALLERGGPGLADLDLGNRVVALHGADMQSIACGSLDRR